jgi:fermentation-respiration switch protein FrsA (DUF1100 family)
MLALRLLTWVLAAYIAIGVYFYAEQSKLLFPAPKDYPHATPADAGFAFDDLRIGGLHAWWIPHSEAGDRTALMFHGNGYVLEYMAQTEAPALHQLGLNLLLIDYRGYGSSAALHPNESTILQDADTAMNYLLKQRQIAPRDLFVIGRSIGSGPAVYLAAKHNDLAGLILESPFSSVDDAAREVSYFRVFPISLMLRTHFDNLNRISQVRIPVFIASGRSDDLTPPWMAQKIFDRAQDPKKLLLIGRAGHNDLIDVGGLQLRDALRAWIHR